MYPLIGRLIGGIGDSFPCMAVGEVVRIYTDEESTSGLWWLASVYSFGSLIGPLMVLFFKDVDFYIASLHVTQLNAIALFMAAFLVLTMFITYFFIHDCSAEIDLKEYLKQQKPQHGKISSLQMKYNDDNANHDQINEIFSIFDDSDKIFLQPMDLDYKENESLAAIPMKVLVRGWWKSSNALLMFTSTVLFSYTMFSAELLFPLLTIEVVGWSLTTLTWLLVIYR